MNLFSRKASTAPEPEITGTEAIRRRVYARWRKVHLARTAADLQLPLPDLEAFAKGEKSRLPEAAMRALVKEMYPNGNVAFDPVADKLIDTSPPGKPLCAGMPEPYKNPNTAVQQAYDAYLAAIKATLPPEPERSTPTVPTGPSWPVKRPGFATST